MMKMFLQAAALSALVAAGFGAATGASAATVDTVDATSGQANTYFVPALGLELSSPYYRQFGEDWGWKHNGIASGFTSASLNISAYDVDEIPCINPSTGICELDVIQAWDAATSTWLNLGSLTGADNAFSFTNFDIFGFGSGVLIDDIVAGLLVQILIDQNVPTQGWFVSLGKSVITTDGAGAGNPNPGQVPLPAAALLLMSGLGGLGSLAAMRRRKKA